MDKYTRSELCMIINMLHKENDRLRAENKMLSELKNGIIGGPFLMTADGIFKEKHFTNK